MSDDSSRWRAISNFIDGLRPIVTADAEKPADEPSTPTVTSSLVTPTLSRLSSWTGSDLEEPSSARSNGSSRSSTSIASAILHLRAQRLANDAQLQEWHRVALQAKAKEEQELLEWKRRAQAAKNLEAAEIAEWKRQAQAAKAREAAELEEWVRSARAAKEAARHSRARTKEAQHSELLAFSGGLDAAAAAAAADEAALAAVAAGQGAAGGGEAGG